MASRESPRKSANVTTSAVGDSDLELGNRDHDRITTIQSTSDGTPSKAATPTARRSLEAHSLGAVPPGRDGASRWTSIEEKIPIPLTKLGHRIVDWLRGPKPPRTYRIVPFLERWQTFPARLLARLPKPLRICVFVVTCVIWIVVFAVVIKKDDLQSSVGGLGAPFRLSCVTNLW